MFKLYLQTFVIIGMSGIITLQERGNTISIQSTDTHLSHVTILLPASTEDPGLTPKTGKKQQLVTRHRSFNIFEKCSAPGAAMVCTLHITQIHHVTTIQQKSLCFFFSFLLLQAPQPR